MAAAETYEYATELVALLRDPSSTPEKRRVYVQRFQTAHGGLSIDGIYGPRTRAALASTLDVPESELPPPVTVARPIETTAETTSTTVTPAASTSSRAPRWWASVIRLAEWIPYACDQAPEVASHLASLRPKAQQLLDAWHLAPFSGRVLGQEPPRGTRTRSPVREVPPTPDRSTLQRLWDGSSQWVRDQAQQFAREVRALYEADRRGRAAVRHAVLSEADDAMGDMLGSWSTWVVVALGLLGLYVATRR